jgi:mannose-6-phosphate isomerase-like protein (cupin superfamily)
MKLLGVGVISSLLLALTFTPKAEAFVFPEITPDPDAPSYLFFDGQPFTFVKRGETTNGQYTLRETIVPPGKGAFPHIHQDDDEWLYVAKGTLRIFMGENIYQGDGLIPGVNAPKDILHAYDAPTGTLIYAPRYRIHGVLNPTDTDSELYVLWNPPGFEEIFKEPGIIPVPDLSNVPPTPLDYPRTYAQASGKFGLVSSIAYDQFGEIVFDDFILQEDNRADYVLQIIADGSREIPEPSAISGVLVFGTTGAISIWKRKRKSVSKVA